MNDAIFTRLKLIALVAASTFLVFVKNPLALFILCILFITASGAKTRFGRAKSRLAAVVGISLFVVVFQVIFNSSISVQSRLLLGVITALRLISLSLLVFLFTETTSPSSIVAALSFLPRNVLLMLTISFSLIPVIFEELSNIRLVQESRGLSAKGINAVRSVFPILIPLLNRTLTRAEHIAMVLETRGFEG